MIGQRPEWTTKPAEATFGNIALYRLPFCVWTNIHVRFEVEPFGVGDLPEGSNTLNRPHRLVTITCGQHSLNRRARSPIQTELGFESGGGVAPEWLPQRPHDCNSQFNAAVDVRLEIARVSRHSSNNNYRPMSAIYRRWFGSAETSAKNICFKKNNHPKGATGER